jgi:hypothetical protein
MRAVDELEFIVSTYMEDGGAGCCDIEAARA